MLERVPFPEVLSLVIKEFIKNTENKDGHIITQKKKKEDRIVCKQDQLTNENLNFCFRFFSYFRRRKLV